tara:strand:+ start:194 stop:2224 length:2031 start_codon:yes stop_codon:yes gene_type:complete
VTSLSRLFSPKSIAIVGGGAWCKSVIDQLKNFNYSGELYIINKTKKTISGIKTYESIDFIPNPLDAVFIGVNRDSTIDIVAKLAKSKAGGAVCFASGFKESINEDKNGLLANQALERVSVRFNILGPNCYGFINALDKVSLWPDQHGCTPVTKGVAILTQSSNIAINLTMQSRGLPVAYVVTCGNQLQLDQAKIALFLLNDKRVTAIGFHIEGFKNIRDWEKVSKKAKKLNIPLIAIKTGKTDEAKAATSSHTASIAGNHIAYDALLERLNIKKLNDLSTFLETLKILHCHGELKSNKIASVSCSGGEAAMVADLGVDLGLKFPKLNTQQKKGLRTALGPKVALANPLDYHTYIWRDAEAMFAAWSSIVTPSLALTLYILDYPRSDRCDLADWKIATDVVIKVKEKTQAKIAVVSTLPELMPEEIAEKLLRKGIVAFNGLTEALTACKASITRNLGPQKPLLLSTNSSSTRKLTEFQAKMVLANRGLEIPKGVTCKTNKDINASIQGLKFPLVVKSQGYAHKTENNGVFLNCNSKKQVELAAKKLLGSGSFIIEEMIPKGVEILVGIINNFNQGFTLTIGSGGVFSELSNDNISLLVPSSKKDIKKAINKLKVSKILSGYRGLEGADVSALINTIWALQQYVIENSEKIVELEVNPIICNLNGAFIADALITEKKI